jgi:hypothetical protein
MDSQMSKAKKKTLTLSFRSDPHGNGIEFFDSQGKVLFHVQCVSERNGNVPTLAIHGIDTCVHNKVVYSTHLSIQPRVTNLVHVTLLPYPL